MATTLLEQTRAGHEEIERLERLIVKDFRNQPKSHKDKLMQAHRVRAMLDTMQSQSRRLATIYQDEDGARKEEIAALRGDNVYANFYERLKEVREYHRRHPDMEITLAENDEEALKFEPQVVFSGEEALGRYLDLHEQFNTFLNSKFGRQLDYAEYLENLTNFKAIPRNQRLTKTYREYLSSLVAYLESFYERTQPLGSMAKHYNKLDAEFNERWSSGRVEGWTDDAPSLAGGVALMAPGALDLDAFDTVEELETLGPDRLKEALQALGLKCGGTGKERAQRLYSTKGKSLDEIDRKLFAKGFFPTGNGDSLQGNTQARESALMEAKLAKLCEVLGDVVADTKGNVEKKQARTYEEMQNELQEAEQEAAVDEESDEEEYIYNPLKLPLGWDGKPIPYWLYKLHGLNQEFKCEICGGKSYWGRRAFERHFKESQHQNAMRSRGIPNNKMFFEITQVEDAEQLWQNIQDREKGGFRPEIDEEYEDEEGNVYNKKTYEDLKRQGLI